MALPDQLATQAVILADERHLAVSAETDLVQGVGHELHPREFRSHPETRGHQHDTLRCAGHCQPGVQTARAYDEQRRYGYGRKSWVRTCATWKTVMACVQHVVAFPRGDDSPPCIANVCTARVCIAYHVLLTERSNADGGGSDPCEGRAPSRAEDGCTLTSAVRRRRTH